MVTLLGSLLGFIGSAFPDILRAFRENKDRNHELKILDRQMMMMDKGHQNRLEEIRLGSDVTELPKLYRHLQPTGVRWVDALAGTVRPLITYAFFVLYGLIKFAQYQVVMVTLHLTDWTQALLNVWNLEDQALFATVISFWFGQRLLSKAGAGQMWRK
jgi:hypothetical protein